MLSANRGKMITMADLGKRAEDDEHWKLQAKASAQLGANGK